jgi:hypothetical protein
MRFDTSSPCNMPGDFLDTKIFVEDKVGLKYFISLKSNFTLDSIPKEVLQI